MTNWTQVQPNDRQRMINLQVAKNTADPWTAVAQMAAVIPIPTAPLQGIDSLLSMVQMPPGIPVATVAIGKAGAVNAAVLAARILGLSAPEIAERHRTFRESL